MPALYFMGFILSVLNLKPFSDTNELVHKKKERDGIPKLINGYLNFLFNIHISM